MHGGTGRTAIYYAAVRSPPIFSFMLDQGLFDESQLYKPMVRKILEHGWSFQTKEKNIRAICRFINNIDNGEKYIKYTNGVFKTIIKQTFEDNLKYFIIALNIFLAKENIGSWKYFYRSTSVISQNTIRKLHSYLTRHSGASFDSYTQWIELLNHMLLGYVDSQLWRQMAEQYENDMNITQDDFFSDTFYTCTMNHRMKQYDPNVNYTVYCYKCDIVGKIALYKCQRCNQYICSDCDRAFKLNQLLKMELFDQFNREMQTYENQRDMIHQV